ncbi:MAG: zinc-binding alcohol dehydrogenase family protein, partial [Spirochaetota bacterium]
IYHGKNPFASYPRIPGHEFVGEVVETGDGSRKFKLGDHVVVNPVISCGKCYPCRNGQMNVCTSLQVIGVHCDGGFAQYIAVDESNLFRIPDSMSWDDAVFIEPFSIASNVTSRIGLNGNDRLLIIGAGPIGLTILQVAKMLGSKVAVCDIVDSRLGHALAMGADMVINSGKEDIEAKAADFSDNEGPSAIVDAAGIPGLMASLTRMASPGGRIGILGFSTVISEITQYEITRKELTIVGSRLSNNKFPQVIDWMASKKLDPAALLSRKFPISEARQAFDIIDGNKETILKVVLDMEAL